MNSHSITSTASSGTSIFSPAKKDGVSLMTASIVVGRFQVSISDSLQLSPKPGEEGRITTVLKAMEKEPTEEKWLMSEGNGAQNTKAHCTEKRCASKHTSKVLHSLSSIGNVSSPLLYSAKRINLNEGKGKVEKIRQDGGVTEFRRLQGKAFGPAKTTYDNGTVRYFNYDNNKREGPATEVSWNGTRTRFNYINDQRQGSASEKDAAGNLVSFNFHDGVRQGPAIESFNDLASIFFHYVNGQRQGKAQLICKDDYVIDFDYVDDVMHGKATQVKKDGTVIEYQIVNGTCEGKAKVVFPDQVEISFTYVRGVPEGPAVQIHQDGSSRNFYYRKGVVVVHSPFEKIAGSVGVSDLSMSSFIPSLPMKAPILSIEKPKELPISISSAFSSVPKSILTV